MTLICRILQYYFACCRTAAGCGKWLSTPALQTAIAKHIYDAELWQSWFPMYVSHAGIIWQQCTAITAVSMVLLCLLFNPLTTIGKYPSSLILAQH